MHDSDKLKSIELQVLELVASGLTNKEIGIEIGAHRTMAVRTAVFHTSNICDKLGVKTKLQAVKEAMKRNLIPDTNNLFPNGIEQSKLRKETA